MNKFVIGIGAYQHVDLSSVQADLSRAGFGILAERDIWRELQQAGQPGAMQVGNYFGEKFLKANGAVDVQKIKRFIGDNHHKQKIYNHLLWPLLLAETQKRLDQMTGPVAICGVYFEQAKTRTLIDRLYWLENSQNLTIDARLEQKIVPIPEKLDWYGEIEHFNLSEILKKDMIN